MDNNPGGAIIDLSFLAGTAPPANGPKYRLGAGTTLGQAYSELYQRDLVTVQGVTLFVAAAFVIVNFVDTSKSPTVMASLPEAAWSGRSAYQA